MFQGGHTATEFDTCYVDQIEQLINMRGESYVKEVFAENYKMYKEDDNEDTGTNKWHEQCSKCKNTKHNRDWVYCVMKRAYCDSCSPSCSCDYTYCPACYCQDDSDEDDEDNE